MGKLHSIFLDNGGKIIHKWIHYFEIYESHFERFTGKSPVIFEIGVFAGGSIQMWKEYFGEDCTVVGIDIDPACKSQHEDEGNRIFVETGDQSDSGFLRDVVSKYGNPDIVIDDGSHIMEHLLSTFQTLYPELKNNGVYLVEDLHTCYWEEYGGGLKRPGSFMEFAKDKIDELNAEHTRGAVPTSEITRHTQSITFYDSIAVFEKKAQGKRRDLRTGFIGYDGNLF
jgi:hypothetical protein